jgi:hypothetical protein
MTRKIQNSILYIVSLAIIISYASGIITFSKYSTLQMIFSFFYFTIVLLCLLKGAEWIHLELRKLNTSSRIPLKKISSICLACSLYAAVVAGFFGAAWMLVSKESFDWNPIYRFIIFSTTCVLFFTLIFEVLYLAKEKESDTKIVNQLDYELNRAEMTALRNTLDPHFIFNSLNTLSYLISKDSAKADLFNNKLAQVYRYFLLNKNKEVISIEKEIDFIRSYFSLIQIRHGNKLRLLIEVDKEDLKDILIVPCSLQILIENVIKHNEFSNDLPLNIYLKTDNGFIVIENTITNKPASVDSTNVGLKNIAAQYSMIFNRDIIVEDGGSNFVVKLPLIKNTKTEYV